MKPRLKLCQSGKLILLSDGVSGLNEFQTRQLICKAHGSLMAFSEKYGVDYTGLIGAFSPQAVRFAGSVSTARRLLGLPSRPDKRNIALAANHAKRRTSTKPGAHA